MTGSARRWTHSALFGALWGGAEATVGTVLKASGLPLSGLVMASIALVCLLTLRRLEPRRGVLLTAGAAAALIKTFTLGGLYPGPVLAILLEAGMLELAFLVLRGWGAAVVGGAMVFAAAPVQMVLMIRIVAGRDAATALAGGARAVLGGLGLPGTSPRELLAGAAILTGLAGAAVGAWAWSLGGRVVQRVRGTG